MDKIRIGKDIKISWKILTNGEIVSLVGRNLLLVLIDPLRQKRNVDFQLKENEISFVFRGVDQKHTGAYSLTLWENYEETGQTVVDYCEAFQLVATTCQESEGMSSLSSVQLTLSTANMSIGIPGLSAYEVAVKNGFVGTEQEWLASLKGEPFTYEDFTPEQLEALQKPAVDAATRADGAAQSANTAAGSANTAAQNANNVANSVAELETTIAQKEQARNLAENARVLAEQHRKSSEQQRKTNEQSRETAEEGRNTSETERQQAELSRKEAETSRVSEFNTLKQSAETATGKANTAAQKADTAAENANTAAQNANQAADNIQAELDKKQDALVSGENIKSINGKSVVGSGNVVINETINYLKWTTNVATTRKLVPVELRAKDVRIAYTNNSGIYIVEKYAVEDVDNTNWANDANWKGCRTPLTPLFEKAGAKFNDETGYYEMNGLTDLTENDLFIAWQYPRLSDDVAVTCSFACFHPDKKRQIRTNFPFVTFFRSANQLKLYGQLKLEIFTTASIVSGNTQPFTINSINTYACNTLRKILGVIDVNSTSSNMDSGGGLELLEELYLKRVRVNVLIFKNSPFIIYDCIKYLIDNTSNTKAITITVHPTTYGYLTGSIEPTEQVGGTTEEWQQIVTDAAEKQITFATTE